MLPVLGRKTRFSKPGSIGAAEDDQRPSLLPAEHREAHRKQGQRYQAAILQEQGIRHRSLGDPLCLHRHAGDPQVHNSWASPEKEVQPCHIC